VSRLFVLREAYGLGIIEEWSGGNGTHRVAALLLKKPGNNIAAASVSHLLRSFRTIAGLFTTSIPEIWAWAMPVWLASSRGLTLASMR
jgi:hypothetical protein